jgi:hypothetical protein
MAYTQSDYERERAICDKANAYWEAVAKGRNRLSAEEAAAPEYAACDNDMRGRVEQFEILRDLPDSFTAYLENDKPDTPGNRLAVTVWTGDVLGTAYVRSMARPRSWTGDRQRYGRAIIGGREYAWQGPGAGMYAHFRAIKGQ